MAKDAEDLHRKQIYQQYGVTTTWKDVSGLSRGIKNINRTSKYY